MGTFIFTSFLINSYGFLSNIEGIEALNVIDYGVQQKFRGEMV